MPHTHAHRSHEGHAAHTNVVIKDGNIARIQRKKQKLLLPKMLEHVRLGRSGLDVHGVAHEKRGGHDVRLENIRADGQKAILQIPRHEKPPLVTKDGKNGQHFLITQPSLIERPSGGLGEALLAWADFAGRANGCTTVGGAAFAVGMGMVGESLCVGMHGRWL